MPMTPELETPQKASIDLELCRDQHESRFAQHDGLARQEQRNREPHTAVAMDTPSYITKSTLKSDYKLGANWIARLGAPDKTAPNPHYRSAGSPMRLYRRGRVEAFLAENEVEYLTFLKSGERRSVAGDRAAATKRDETIDWAQTVEIELHPFPAELARAAEVYFMDCLGGTRPQAWCGMEAMLRHAYTNYHELLCQLHNRVGRSDAYEIIRRRVNGAVALQAGVRFDS